jgi:hypothetical protein
MNSSKIKGKIPDNTRKPVDEINFQNLLAYLKHRIHRPTHNVYMQYFNKNSGKDYNWWRENQLLI